MLLKYMLTPRGLAFDRFLVKWTGHSLLNRIFARNSGFEPQPALLLVTRGRKSGQPRSVALPYFVLEGKLMVVGSKGGAPTDPAWALNLRDNPEVTIYIKRKPRKVRARIAQGEERARYWQRLTEIVKDYGEYERRTEREIPVIILDEDYRG